MAHGSEAPSAWVERWSHLLAPQANVLDIACGLGRHMRYFSNLGHSVTGVDRNPEAIQAVSALGEAILADIENGPWPLPNRSFDAVVVTNYLWRPLWPQILASLAPKGVLIYETFSIGNETVGKPSRPDFLLKQGELLSLCQDLRVVAFEEGFLPSPDRFIQRIVAMRTAPDAPQPQKFLL